MDCSTISSCGTCTSTSGCGWCDASSSCLAGDRDGPTTRGQSCANSWFYDPRDCDGNCSKIPFITSYYASLRSLSLHLIACSIRFLYGVYELYELSVCGRHLLRLVHAHKHLPDGRLQRRSVRYLSVLFLVIFRLSCLLVFRFFVRRCGVFSRNCCACELQCVCCGCWLRLVRRCLCGR